MSLKDRLNNGIRTAKPKEEIKSLSKPSAAAGAAYPNGINILEAMLIDENVNSVYINGAKNIYIERKGKLLKSTVSFRDNIQLTNLILKLAQEAGIEENEISSYMKFPLKQGILVKAVLPPVCNLPSLYIKCYHDKLATVRNFQDTGIISKELALIFEALASIKYNIIIAGDADTLKTSILSAISKLLPANTRGFIFDNHGEVKTKAPSCSVLNLSSLVKKEALEIIHSIITSNPDKIILNDEEENLLNCFIKPLKQGYKGLITTVEALSREEALDKVLKTIKNENPDLNDEDAKNILYSTFNLIIFCKKDREGVRKITSIAEIEKTLENNHIIKDIFVLNKNENGIEEHSSTGVIPKLYELAKSDALPINPNIFVNDYKHTYAEIIRQENTSNKFKNIDVLKKFKKELNNGQVSLDIASSDDFIKKAQEKFEALKRNAKIQENEAVEKILSDDKPATIQDINSSLNDTES